MPKTAPRIRLGINIDHVATVRNARRAEAWAQPDILRAAQEVIKGGADGITFHLREDRRHMLDGDAVRLMKHIKKPINLEMAATAAMARIALALRPHAVCIVPEKRKEITTEGGLNAARGGKKLSAVVNMLAMVGIRVSLFIDPEAEQVLAAWTSGAAVVEFHTGAYANAKGAARKRELKKIVWAAQQAHKLGLEVHAGHGLTYENVKDIAAIPEIVELNIGHFLIGEALFTGLSPAVKRMKKIMLSAR